MSATVLRTLQQFPLFGGMALPAFLDHRGEPLPGHPLPQLPRPLNGREKNIYRNLQHVEDWNTATLDC